MSLLDVADEERQIRHAAEIRSASTPRWISFPNMFAVCLKGGCDVRASDSGVESHGFAPCMKSSSLCSALWRVSNRRGLSLGHLDAVHPNRGPAAFRRGFFANTAELVSNGEGYSDPDRARSLQELYAQELAASQPLVMDPRDFLEEITDEYGYVEQNAEEIKRACDLANSQLLHAVRQKDFASAETLLSGMQHTGHGVIPEPTYEDIALQHLEELAASGQYVPLDEFDSVVTWWSHIPDESSRGNNWTPDIPRLLHALLSPGIDVRSVIQFVLLAVKKGYGREIFHSTMKYLCRHLPPEDSDRVYSHIEELEVRLIASSQSWRNSLPDPSSDTPLASITVRGVELRGDAMYTISAWRNAIIRFHSLAGRPRHALKFAIQARIRDSFNIEPRTRRLLADVLHESGLNQESIILERLRRGENLDAELPFLASLLENEGVVPVGDVVPPHLADLGLDASEAGSSLVEDYHSNWIEGTSTERMALPVSSHLLQLRGVLASAITPSAKEVARIMDAYASRENMRGLGLLYRRTLRLRPLSRDRIKSIWATAAIVYFRDTNRPEYAVQAFDASFHLQGVPGYDIIREILRQSPRPFPEVTALLPPAAKDYKIAPHTHAIGALIQALLAPFPPSYDFKERSKAQSIYSDILAASSLAMQKNQPSLTARSWRVLSPHSLPPTFLSATLTPAPIQIPDSVYFHHFIRVFGKLDGPTGASRVFEDMRRLNVQPSLRNWNLLLREYALAGETKATLSLLDIMEGQVRARPDPRDDQSITMRTRLGPRPFDPTFCPRPNVWTYISGLSGFLRHHHLDEALEVSERLAASGVDMDEWVRDYVDRLNAMLYERLAVSDVVRIIINPFFIISRVDKG